MSSSLQSFISMILAAVSSMIDGLVAADSTGLPRTPNLDPIFAASLAHKWYNKPGYFTRYSIGPLANTATCAAGELYWKVQIMEDGAPRAWVNFVNSKQPVADGVAASVAALVAAGDTGPFAL